MNIGFECKYFVIKVDDVKKYLDVVDQKFLAKCFWKIEECRRRDGKKAFNDYLVVNTDEPYASEVAEIMKKHGHCTSGGEIKVNISVRRMRGRKITRMEG